MIKKNTRNKIINSEYFFVKKFNKQNVNSFKNEIYANKYLKNKKIYNLPKIKKIISKKNISLIYFEKFEPTSFKLDFFRMSKFINVKKLNFKNIEKRKYIKNLYYLTNKIKRERNEVYLILKKLDIYLKSPNISLKINISHGDFNRTNTFSYKNKFYVCDLEYFNEFRTYLYDLFDWYFNVALNFIIKFRLTLFSNFILLNIYNLLKWSNFNLDKQINIDIRKYNLILYFIEKVILLKSQVDMNKIKNKKIYIILKFLKKNLA